MRPTETPMSRFETLNLIALFDFYLATMFVLSLYRRRSVYFDAVRLGFSTVGKRQKLLGIVAEHKASLLSGEVLRPMLVAFGVMLVQFILSRLVFPQAKLSVIEVESPWWKAAMILAAFVPMFAVDVYFLIRVGRFSHGETAKYLDYAEKWLGKRGSAVRLATFGFVNPRKIVGVEVQKNLKELGATVSWSMRWVTIQVVLRTTFGLAIWLLWATG